MITINEKGFKLTDDERALVMKKAEKLPHLNTELHDESAKITINFMRNAHADNIECKTIISLPHPSATLVASAVAETAVAGFDQVEQELRPQLEKHKNK